MKSLFTRESQPGLRALTLIIISMILMVMDQRTTVVDQLRRAISIPLTPIQYVVSSPVRLFDQIKNMVSSRDALEKENLELKTQQLLLKAQMQRLLSIESENAQLKALLKAAAQVQGKVLIAQLLEVATEPFVNQVVLDKGSRDNVFVGQPVLDANGVMGQVIQVSLMTSRVLLVNDPRSGVPVQNTRNGIRAIAMGDAYSGKMHLVNVPHTADIRADDVFVTSGLGQNYPEGYPIGHVQSVVKDPGLSFATIIIEPAAHLDRAREVLLVWPSGKKGPSA